MTSFVGVVPEQKMRVEIEKHSMTPQGLAWVEKNRASGMDRDDLDFLVSQGMASRTYKEVNHNVILNGGLDFIAESVLEVLGIGTVTPVVDGMALGTGGTPAAGADTGLQTPITDSFNVFATGFPVAGPLSHELQYQTFWGANDPPGGPFTIVEVAILVAIESNQEAVSRITSGLNVTKTSSDTLTIKITWSIGTPA